METPRGWALRIGPVNPCWPLSGGELGKRIRWLLPFEWFEIRIFLSLGTLGME